MNSIILPDYSKLYKHDPPQNYLSYSCPMPMIQKLVHVGEFHSWRGHGTLWGPLSKAPLLFADGPPDRPGLRAVERGDWWLNDLRSLAQRWLEHVEHGPI